MIVGAFSAVGLAVLAGIVWVTWPSLLRSPYAGPPPRSVKRPTEEG